jgi:hypothetical protein
VHCHMTEHEENAMMTYFRLVHKEWSKKSYRTPNV